MREMIMELVEFRHLLYTLTWRDIKVRYKQSIMGFMWAIFMPMIIVAAGILVKEAFSLISGKPLELSSLASVSVKSLPWAFFVGALKFSTNSLISNRNLVTKIYFPREVCPIAAVLASLLDFLIASAALTVILIIARIGISVHILLLPLLLIPLLLFVTGLGLLLSCANLFFRDVKYLVDVVITFAIFFTPVFYEASMFEKWETLLLLNPMGAILESINSAVVLHQAPALVWVLYSYAWGVGTFLLSWRIFHKSEYLFAENI